MARPQCFIIQPFDGGRFDDLYRQIFSPALMSIGIRPCRVDSTVSADEISEKVFREIERSLIVIAEISLDNPNVWLETGYAIAKNRPTLMICDRAERPEELPFDVRTRGVFFYDSRTLNYREMLESQIVDFGLRWLTSED